MDLYFQGIWRMDWGLGNPNKTAALIAILMVAVWVLAYLRRWMFWVVMPVFAALGICLIHTFSRGGVIAASCGLAVVLWRCPRPWPWRRIFAVLAAVWVIIGASVYLEATKRFGQGVVHEDRSITNRIELWKAAPRMIMDAPAGWGLGKAGETYIQWYQPLDRGETYRTLVNSHLTWLVEFSWPWRILYLLGWNAMLVLCWPTAKARWTIVPFGVWLTFAIGAFFSSVAESPWLWVVPGLATLAVLGTSAWKGWPPIRRWLYPPLATAAVILLLAIVAVRTVEMPIRCETEFVKIGAGVPTVRVLPFSPVFGNYPGRALRGYWLTSPEPRKTMAVSRDSIRPLSGGEKILLTGGALSTASLSAVRSQFRDCERVILLNPAFFPEEMGLATKDTARLRVVFGEFSGSSAASAWDALLGSAPRSEGVGDYLPEWPKMAFSQSP
jgi:hypothetical protein